MNEKNENSVEADLIKEQVEPQSDNNTSPRGQDIKLRDFVRLFRKDRVEKGVYAFQLKLRYSSKLAMYRGYDPDNDLRIQFDNYEEFIESLPDLYVRSVELDIGGPNTWCERITVSLHERDYDPKTGRMPHNIRFRDL